MDYYLWLNDAQQGPYSIGQLKQMWASGTINKTIKVWHDGLADWQTMESMESLLFPPSPPPLPASYPPPQYIPIQQSSSSSSSAGVVTAGVICSLVSLLFLPPAFGLAALVCGIVALAKGTVGGGICVIIMAVACTMGGMFVGALLMSR